MAGLKEEYGEVALDDYGELGMQGDVPNTVKNKVPATQKKVSVDVKQVQEGAGHTIITKEL